MTRFNPEFTPYDADEFTQGYLDCAEWLLDEDVNRDKLRGWTKRAVKQAVADCEAFQGDNRDDLEAYQEATGRDMASAGHDFWCTRNRHGVGFWSRGDHPCLQRLTEAAHSYGAADTYVERGWINFL